MKLVNVKTSVALCVLATINVILQMMMAVDLRNRNEGNGKILGMACG